ncbi:hypothetical protein [Dictyobacter formicarum]|uniref:Transposase n=1 Tax=Dictyobacter formicarum TaxID=2778368 RepID=A0ABQ3VPS4_9CHLR|nr:hypothetical protein [Dictyobacter formicarum]GHO88139.1 hypothetical protein KSZ_61450 [Dictyobacter formicarum]GHO88259.1 hypothetical protein KSZ_62650 [Dictyobacter formicarum]
MSTNYSYSSYEQDRIRQAEERKNAPPQCPHCGAAINQDLSAYGSKVRYHCGSQACRKAVSRANIAERKRQERHAARARILTYCEQQLDSESKRAVMEMTDLLMNYDQEHGHDLAQSIVQVIEAKRCKHDRIAVLIESASAAKRQAREAVFYNQELEALYTHRIKELESELSMYQLLQKAIDDIAAQQLGQQREEPEEDEDQARVLATLAQAGLRPYIGQQEDEDDPEE